MTDQAYLDKSDDNVFRETAEIAHRYPSCARSFLSRDTSKSTRQEGPEGSYRSEHRGNASGTRLMRKERCASCAGRGLFERYVLIARSFVEQKARRREGGASSADQWREHHYRVRYGAQRAKISPEGKYSINRLYFDVPSVFR
jgi:hypothetical protein